MADFSGLSFSAPVNCSLFAWSPDSFFLARVVNDRVLIQNVKDDILAKAATLPAIISEIEWSSDSSYLACASYRTGTIQIFSVDQPSWQCKIELGSEETGVGLEGFCWSPNARSILTTASEFIQLSVWSISEKTVVNIQDILPIKKNKSFSSDGEFIAVARFDNKFSPIITLYYTSKWLKIRNFPIICKDLQEVAFCPNNTSILLRDSILFNNICIYSLTGDLLKQFSPDGLSLGIPLAKWSPTGQVLVTMNHRNFLRVLNGLTYGLLLEEKIEAALLRTCPKCQMISEVIVSSGSDIGISTYELEEDLPIIPGTLPSPNESIKFKSKVKFSWDGKFFACWTNAHNTTLWIFDGAETSLTAVIIQLHCISDFDWAPFESVLCLCTETNFIYFWSPQAFAVKSILVPGGSELFQCKKIKFSPVQPSIALVSKDQKIIICDLNLNS